MGIENNHVSLIDVVVYLGCIMPQLVASTWYPWLSSLKFSTSPYFLYQLN